MLRTGVEKLVEQALEHCTEQVYWMFLLTSIGCNGCTRYSARE